MSLDIAIFLPFHGGEYQASSESARGLCRTVATQLPLPQSACDRIGSAQEQAYFLGFRRSLEHVQSSAAKFACPETRLVV